MRTQSVLFALAFASLWCGSCQDCNRSACQSYQRPAAASIGQGVAGVVASESDVVANGCQECGLASATLEIWLTNGLVQDAVTVGAIARTTPLVAMQADGHYEIELAPADYLLCVDSGMGGCVPFAVASGKVTTVNVQRINGPTGFLVFDAGSSVPRTSQVLSVTPSS
jgi:hypothetical protein